MTLETIKKFLQIWSKEKVLEYKAGLEHTLKLNPNSVSAKQRLALVEEFLKEAPKVEKSKKSKSVED